MRKQIPPGVRPPVALPEAMAWLAGHDWEGNVRELENRVESAIALAKNGLITVEDFFPEDSAGTDPDYEMPSLHAFRVDMVRDAEEDYLVCGLRMTKGNMSTAATIAGMHRTHLYRLCRQDAIEPSEFRKNR